MMGEIARTAAEVTKRAAEGAIEAMRREVASLPEEIGTQLEHLPEEIGGNVPYKDLREEEGSLPPDVRIKGAEELPGKDVMRHDEAPIFKMQPPKDVSTLPSKTGVDPMAATDRVFADSKLPEGNVEKTTSIVEKIEQDLSTPEGIKALIERHPEKAEQWKQALDSINVLNDPDATPTEIRSAQAKLSGVKGQLLETATKDALSDSGLTVESQQRLVDGESGGTKPDVIAKNDTDQPIEVFGITLQPGETLSVECKCGSTEYITNQLNNHIPNQLSGQIGEKVLLTTNDIKGAPSGLADRVCEKYGAKLVVPDISVRDVENAMKGVHFE